VVTAPNAALAYAVLDQIDAHPESWSQRTWWCETSGCFAGWACALSGDTPVLQDYGYLAGGISVADRASKHLGFEDWDDLEQRHVHLNPSGERGLFSEFNTRADLGRMVAEIFGPRPAVAE